MTQYYRGIRNRFVEYDTGCARDIETTIFDPARDFLNFLYLVYLLYCCFTPVNWPNPDCSFYLPVSMSRVLPVGCVPWKILNSQHLSDTLITDVTFFFQEPTVTSRLACRNQHAPPFIRSPPLTLPV